MNEALEKHAQAYAATLHDYLAGGGEVALARAYELGRKVIDSGLGALDMNAMHRETLLEALCRARTPRESADIAKRASDVLGESLAPLEMARHGFSETVTMLRRLNEVERQTAEQLAAANNSSSSGANRQDSASMSRSVSCQPAAAILFC
jgi:sigma-B regulation protein RsbU (phosphoserine phosphatase)